MLTLENLIKPTLAGIPGVERVEHRSFIRDGEAARIGARRVDTSGLALGTPAPGVKTRDAAELPA
ncbi:hypothetical protein [Thiorhodococcus minor]|nr:hypothetical protein [Thiorhodococcus minor]